MTRIASHIVIILAVASAAFAQTANTATKTILQRAMVYQLQLRSGQMNVVPDYVAMLEEATNADPGTQSSRTRWASRTSRRRRAR